MNKTPEGRYPCDRCGRTFDSMDELAQHAREIHAGEPAGVRSQGIDETAITPPPGDEGDRTTDGDVVQPGSSYRLSEPDEADKEQEDKLPPSTRGTSAGGRTTPGAP